ncbi:3-oxoacyl-[acyl-carrier protein] reductase [Enterococcus sp. PF1-24]|uniref:3-oxoacyl-ACP reductase n=1 Tax=unclassified Enterococcus TaxID=2608891 RepID=UPI002474C9E5|nr:MULTISPECIES: 3-oxoacyl-ACP reductase [unclassified Enterococcus]MDH6363252.1 3-oxoacyl-[acyl-carrier protein] reductase [Enterococcus sp. PFB1-1]MDH6400447.1 3-oxoacyl-[acyl-carrier protein] reductase [Enterococcus sp. PF1-24]
MKEFENKVVLVTGAASGIGYAQAEAFLKAGAKVFAVDIQADFGDLGNEYSENFATFSGDLSIAENCQAAVNICEKIFGKVEILLNTAGILDEYKPLIETDEQLWHKILSTNLDSMFYLTKAVLPNMLDRKAGTIINMASIAGLVAGGGGIAYTTAKHAIAGFTKQLALDYAAEGIHVNGIAPGAIKTPMNAADFAGDGAMAKWVAEETPVKRWAQPQEVAELTLFLASEKSSYLQGNIVPIDGGWLLK